MSKFIQTRGNRMGPAGNMAGVLHPLSFTHRDRTGRRADDRRSAGRDGSNGR